LSHLLDNIHAAGLLDSVGLERARVLLDEGKPLEDAILGADGVTEESLLRHLADSFGLPYVDLDREPPSKEFVASFPTRVLVRHQVLPLREEDGITLVATSRLTSPTALDELRMVSGRDCTPALAPRGDIDRWIKRLLGVGADTLQSLDAEAGLEVVDAEADDDLDVDSAAQDASIIRFVNQVLTEAVEMRATDIHIEPYEDELRLRYRIDGVLQNANVPPSIRRFHPAIVSRLKILSHLDIAEKRLPQDGRIKIRLGGREIDIRVSIIPMIHGEAVVLRVLHRGDAMLGPEHLGMAERDRKLFNRTLEMPHGIVLVTGPTGSGKTTTLYAALASINDASRKIITIEDPVEYQLRGVNQIQVSNRTGLSFAAGLRAILRHDPDVVLVGEIRDRETAEIAVQASLTGHLVFSTLHTNDAPGAATRLIDMGVEPYLVASSVEVVIAQRLVRVICNKCRQPVPDDETRRLRSEFGSVVPERLFRGAGCRDCQGTGFRGRVGIFELMDVDDELRTLILHRAPAPELRRAADKRGMRGLREDGWRVVAEGRTTVEEVVRTTKDAAHTAFEDPSTIIEDT
jgi:type II secretion system protein E